MSLVDKYSSKVSTEELTYSEEGLYGGAIGFLVGGTLGFFTGGLAGASAVTHLQGLRKEINEVSKKIAKLRNEQLDEAEKEGIELPSSFKHTSTAEVIGGAIGGMYFGPIMGIVLGSAIEDENKKLKHLLEQLAHEAQKKKDEK